MDHALKGPSIIEGYPMWREKRDKEYDAPNLIGSENKLPQENTVEDYYKEARARNPF